MDKNLLHILACRICYPCEEPDPNLEKVTALKLPTEFNHILCAPNKNASSKYEGLVLRSQCNSNEGAEHWLSAYSTSSGTTWDVLQTEPENLKKYVFKRVYRCSSSKKIKPTNTGEKKSTRSCSARITIIVIKPKSQKIHQDLHLPEYPMTLRFNGKHNHELKILPTRRKRSLAGTNTGTEDVYTRAVTHPKLSPQEGVGVDSIVCEALEEMNHNDSSVVSHMSHYQIAGSTEKVSAPASTTERLAPKHQRQVNPQLVGKFQKLYRHKHSPDSALATHILDLQVEHRERWQELAEDRFYCPDRTWCTKLYKSVQVNAGGPEIQFLQELFSAYASVSHHCQLQQLPDGHFAGIVVTPVMLRNYDRNLLATEVGYVSSYVTGSACVYLLSCNSPWDSCVGLPLAFLLASAETEPCLAAALSLYKSVAGRSPAVLMTSDSAPLRSALRSAYPECRLQLGLYHVLQAAWLYALDELNGIPETHQVYLYQTVLGMVMCVTELELLYQVRAATDQATDQASDNFSRYINALYDRRKDWSLCYWDAATREHNTLDSGIALMRDVVLNRLSGFNTLQMAHFVLSRLDRYHRFRLWDAAAGEAGWRRWEGPPSSDSTCTIPASKVSHLSSSIYLVESKRGDTEYLVNETVGGCSCARGRYGAACQHQHAVSLFCRGGAARVQAATLSGEMAALLREIAGTESRMREAAEDFSCCDAEYPVTGSVNIEDERAAMGSAAAGSVTTESRPILTHINSIPDVSCDPMDVECNRWGSASLDVEHVSTDSGFVLTESGYVTNGSEHKVDGLGLDCATTEVAYDSASSHGDRADPASQFLAEDRVNQCIINISNSLVETYSDDPALFESAIIKFERLFNAKRSKVSFAAALISGNFALPTRDEQCDKERQNCISHREKRPQAASAVKGVKHTKKQLAMVTGCSVTLQRINVQQEIRRLRKKNKQSKSCSTSKKPWITSGKISKKLFIKNHGFALSRKSSVCEDEDAAIEATT